MRGGVAPTSKACLKTRNGPARVGPGGAGVSSGHIVRWAAHESGGLKSLRRSDEERHIRKRR